MNSPTKKAILYESLKKEINSGYLLPGSRLVEMDLVAKYKVSRTIIREVLRQLVLERMVDLVPYKGASVAKWSLRDIEEVYRIQQDLEGLATYLATILMSKTKIEELEQIHHSSIRQGGREVSTWQKWNARFHGFLVRNCGNQQLFTLIRGYHNQFARYWFPVLSIPGNIEISIKEHQEILEAIKARKPSLARHRMERHLSGGIKKILEILKKSIP